MLKDYYFWFAQPSTVLNNYDWYTGYFFSALFILSIIIWAAAKFSVQHPIWKKMLYRWANAIFWIGIVGLIWFGFRYEAIPIFSKRIVPGVILGVGLIWLGFIKWYFIRHFFREKREYDYVQVKNKYIK